MTYSFIDAVTGYIKLALQAGKANPAPPVGPALGSKVIYCICSQRARHPHQISFISFYIQESCAAESSSTKLFWIHLVSAYVEFQLMTLSAKTAISCIFHLEFSQAGKLEHKSWSSSLNPTQSSSFRSHHSGKLIQPEPENTALLARYM